MCEIQINKAKGVQHVTIVYEHSKMNLRMIDHMTKKLLMFTFFRNSSQIVWGENEETKGCTTCKNSQLTTSK